ncbi:hypothetical protein GP486_005897 [Trichoglossum hirsutum]|uniref:DUF7708 domain-containing protein n=1 Tax=Trichoglossum hirsutum TaxID=265104 RepID=A0A9P8RLS4_9PEZI|nr:hypothetical protein GP486_005897 [Trichoglossum hirsutum]
MFMDLRNCFPRYSEYQALYPCSARLQAALCTFYATVIQFCTKALEAIQRKGIAQAATAIWRPFEAEFGDFRNELQRQDKNVQDEISLAFQQAHSQEQLLQVMEREAASRYRYSGYLFRRRATQDSDEARNWRLQISERKSSWFCLSYGVL